MEKSDMGYYKSLLTSQMVLFQPNYINTEQA